MNPRPEVRPPNIRMIRGPKRSVAQPLARDDQLRPLVMLALVHERRAEQGIVLRLSPPVQHAQRKRHDKHGRKHDVVAPRGLRGPALGCRPSTAVRRVMPHAKHTTGDTDVVRRRWLLTDFDPIRPTGIGSTDEEHEADSGADA